MPHLSASCAYVMRAFAFNSEMILLVMLSTLRSALNPLPLRCVLIEMDAFAIWLGRFVSLCF